MARYYARIVGTWHQALFSKTEKDIRSVTRILKGVSKHNIELPEQGLRLLIPQLYAKVIKLQEA